MLGCDWTDQWNLLLNFLKDVLVKGFQLLLTFPLRHFQLQKEREGIKGLYEEDELNELD